MNEMTKPATRESARAEDDFWDDLFHGCAWGAFRDVGCQTGQFPPDSEATRRLAYRYYEDALAEKNGRPRRPVSQSP
jgi:hypothetical protein